MANAKLRRKAHEGLRELNAHELGAVSGAWGVPTPDDSHSLTIPNRWPQRQTYRRSIVPVVIPWYL